MHLVIATREDPFLPLARMRARGQLTELRAADLRFTPAEAAEFLNRMMNLDLSAEDVNSLEARTEGWIAGLQLAAIALQSPLTMQGRDDISNFIHAFTGSHRFVLDYLAEEVLQRLPEHIRSFLLHTSILDRLTGSLCDTVTKRDDSKEMLDTLERDNLFVIALDDQRQWYRYHHLFAEVLQAHLTEEFFDQIPALHLRASRWFEQNGWPADAIHHALVAEDWERAAGLIELAHPAMDISYQSAAWLAWAKSLPGELIRTRPVLCVDFAWALLDSGEMEACEQRLLDAEHWLDAAADLPEEDRRGVVVDEVQFRSLPASIATARAYRSLALGDVPAAVKYAQKALIITPSDDPIRHLQAVSLLGVAQYTSGGLEAAERSLTDIHARLLKSQEIMVLLGIAYLLAEIRVALGRLREAESTYQQAVQLATNQGESPPVGTSDLYRGLGELACEQGDLQTAAGYLQIAQNLGKQTALTGWSQRLCVAQARLKEAQGDLDGALGFLDEAERVYVQAPLPDVRPVPALRARIWIRQGRLSEAQVWTQAQSLSVNAEISYLHEFEYIVLARLLVAQSSRTKAEVPLDEVVNLLLHLLQAAETGNRLGSVIEILVVLALAQQAQGNLPGASATLARALVLAEPQGYIRIFVNEGEPMAALLREVSNRGIVPDYVRRLQASFVKASGKKPSGTQPLIEPLSEREIEVLRLLSSELSGPEIAQRLTVSLNTLRTHTKNIYNKLGVNNRRAAVRRAREFDLI